MGLALRALVVLGLLATLAFWGRAIHTLAATPPPPQSFAWIGPDGRPTPMDVFHPEIIGVIVGDSLWHFYTSTDPRWRAPGQHRSLWMGRTRPQEGRREIAWSLPADRMPAGVVPAGFWPLPDGDFLVATHVREPPWLGATPENRQPHLEISEVYRVSPGGGVYRYPPLAGRILALMTVGDRVEAVVAEAQEVSRQARVAWCAVSGGAWHEAPLAAVPESLFGGLGNAAARRLDDAELPPDQAWTVWGVFTAEVPIPAEGPSRWGIWRLQPGEPWVQTQQLQLADDDKGPYAAVALERAPAGGFNVGGLNKAQRFELRGEFWAPRFEAPEGARSRVMGLDLGPNVRLTPAGLEPESLHGPLFWTKRSDGCALQRVERDQRSARAVAGAEAGPTVLSDCGLSPDAALGDEHGGFWVLAPGLLPDDSDWIHVDADLTRVDVMTLGARLHRWHRWLALQLQLSARANWDSEAYENPDLIDLLWTLDFPKPTRIWWIVALFLALFGLPLLLLLAAWPRRARIWTWPAASAAWALAVSWSLPKVWAALGAGAL